jgi:hypothetical protein
MLMEACNTKVSITVLLKEHKLARHGNKIHPSKPFVLSCLPEFIGMVKKTGNSIEIYH